MAPVPRPGSPRRRRRLQGRRRLRRRRFFLGPEPTEGAVAARGHVACAADDRFLLVFGGAAGHALADADVHAYDTWSHRWVKRWR